MRFGMRGGWQGAMDLSRPDRPVFPYQRAFSALVEAENRLERFLSIGVGTGTSLRTVRRQHPTAVLHGIEIDETVLNIAIEYFDAPSHREADYWVGDGVAFLQSQMLGGYDVVFVDAYMRNAIYQKSLQGTVVEALATCLAEDGVAVYNIIAQNFALPQLRAFLRHAHEAFTTVLDWPVGVPFSSQNRLVVLTNRREYHHELSAFLRKTPLFDIERRGWGLRIRTI